MEFGFIFILLGVIFGISIIIKGNTPKSCKDYGMLHIWINGTDGLYCEKCKNKPSQIITAASENQDDFQE